MSSSAEEPKPLETMEAIDRTINRVANGIAKTSIDVDKLDKRSIILRRLLSIRRSLQRQTNR